MSFEDSKNVPGGPGNKGGQKFETLMLHVGQEQKDPVSDARATPIYLTTSYVFDSCDDAADRFALKTPGNIYSRLTNTTTDVFERRIAALEGGTSALATASGAAAITYAINNLAFAGDHIVSSTTIYGGTYNFFEHTLRSYGVDCTFVDPTKPGCIGNFEAAIKDNTKCVFVETIGNPNANLIDIDAMAEMCHRHGIPLVVDNTFATPYLFRPLEHGADIVIESATKFIGGHGLALGGVIVENARFDWAGSGKFRHLVDPDPSYHGVSFVKDLPEGPFCGRIRAIILRDMGACLSPIHSFMFIQSLETLSLRVERHVYNAIRVVEFLSKHPKVQKVNHPCLPDHPDHSLYEKYFPNGAGSIFTFETKGGKEGAKRFSDSMKLFSLLANVADMKSLVIHPASTTHSQMNEAELESSGIGPSTVRLSIGCEHIDDIIADLAQALDKIRCHSRFSERGRDAPMRRPSPAPSAPRPSGSPRPISHRPSSPERSTHTPHGTTGYPWVWPTASCCLPCSPARRGGSHRSRPGSTYRMGRSGYAGAYWRA